jgi:endonuclease YncB( thermonuclease family)
MSLLFFAAALTVCAPGPRDNCVVDGDTLWLAGEKIRIADIDAPEMNGRCSAEIQRAILSQERLLVLLNAKPFKLHREGTDRFGRTLAIVVNAEGSIGDQLVREGLARTWSEHREPWC